MSSQVHLSGFLNAGFQGDEQPCLTSDWNAGPLACGISILTHRIVSTAPRLDCPESLFAYTLSLTQFTILFPELRVHVGDPIQMGCFFRSTEERRVTRVNWMFSSGKHAQVRRRKPHCTRSPWLKAEWGEEDQLSAPWGGVTQTWALEFVRFAFRFARQL